MEKQISEKINSIKVLGAGCKSCKQLYQNVLDALNEYDAKISVEYISDIGKIIEYNVFSMPALVINNEVYKTGRVYSVSELKKIFDNF